MNRKESIYLFSGMLLALLLIASTYSSSMIFAQTLPANGTNVTKPSAPNLKGPLINRLKTNVIPKLLENVSSLSNVVAISTVDGIKFTGINIGDTNLSVTLSRQPTANNTTANKVSNTSLPVTILVSKVPISNLTEVMSMVQSSRNMATAVNNINPSGGGATVDLGSMLASNPAVQSNGLRILSALKNVQIGVGAFVRPNWSSPQTISLGLIGLPQAASAASSASTNVILVAVLPYRGTTNLSTLPFR
jgi:hypothetical protein